MLPATTDTAAPSPILPPIVTHPPTPAGPPPPRIRADGAVFLADALLLNPAVELPHCPRIKRIEFAPNNAYFVVLLDCGGDDLEAYSFRADGGEKRRLTGEWDKIWGNLYEWSADGAFFQYVRRNSCCETPPADAPVEGVVLVEIGSGGKREPVAHVNPPSATLSGSGIIQVTDQPGFQYTPDIASDQRRLILSAQINDRWQIAVVDLQNGNRWQQLTNEAANYFQPQFSPDGQWLFFQSLRSGNMEIYRQPFTGCPP
jgi:dipeptidyl aminopeptidase/acylaminoacyl peptidase